MGVGVLVGVTVGVEVDVGGTNVAVFVGSMTGAGDGFEQA